MQTEPTTKPDPAPRSRRMRIALVLSLALNLMFIGILAGGAFQGARAPQPSWEATDLRALLRALPDDARRDLRGAMIRGNGESPRVRREQMRNSAAEHRLRTVAMLRADPFDADAFAEHLDTGRAAREARTIAAHHALVARIAAMPARERAAMAERLSRRTERAER